VNLGFALAAVAMHRAEARRVLDDAIGECRAVGNVRLEGWARAHVAGLALANGDAASAESEARTAAELLATSPGLRAWALGVRARALVRLGRAAEALEDARAAVATLDALDGLLQGESIPPLALVEALRACGEDATSAIASAKARLARRADRLGRDEWRASFLAIAENAATLAL